MDITRLKMIHYVDKNNKVFAFYNSDVIPDGLTRILDSDIVKYQALAKPDASVVAQLAKIDAQLKVIAANLPKV